MKADVKVRNYGSIILVFPETPLAKDWVDDNVGDHMEWAGGIVVEPRYAFDLVQGMQKDGLAVQLVH